MRDRRIPALSRKVAERERNARLRQEGERADVEERRPRGGPPNHRLQPDRGPLAVPAEGERSRLNLPSKTKRRLKEVADQGGACPVEWGEERSGPRSRQ
jgi:hypothetical protein